MCSYIYFLMFNSNTICSFFMLSFYCVLLAMFGVICKATQLVCNTFFSSIGTQWNDNCEGGKWDHFNWFLLSFSFLDPKVNNFDSTHECPLRNQNDILDNPIPCKLTWSVYSIWIINYRYHPKYASQYKSKHTNYVKLSNLVL
jgi:hypothetical protein